MKTNNDEAAILCIVWSMLQLRYVFGNILYFTIIGMYILHSSQQITVSSECVTIQKTPKK